MIEKGKLFLYEGLSKRTSTVAGGILPVFLKILPENEASKGDKPETESRGHYLNSWIKLCLKLFHACTFGLQKSF